MASGRRHSRGSIVCDFKGVTKDEEATVINKAVVEMTNTLTWVRMRMMLRSS